MSGAHLPKRPGLSDFRGNERFEIVQRLGSGGMGVVYEAVDRSSGSHVALKTLSLADATSIYRFKKEFRGLSDISHVNLAALYELFVGEGQWFFTMELVRGTDLRSFLRSGLGTSPDDATEKITDQEVDRVRSARDSALIAAPFNIDLLRSCMAQLAEGLHALHLAGRIHRDVKPSNVLVSEEELRVVLVDFGLSTEVAEVDSISDRVTVGTVAYMSPEQASQGQLGPASDWYSLGSVLYELLTGELPFVGPGSSVLMKKQEEDPVDPRSLVAELPDDLCDLCMALLHRNPNARPLGTEVLRRLGSEGEKLAPLRGYDSSGGDVFVGRESQIASLDAALQLVASDELPQCVLVHGSPGIGKTALLRRFSDMAREKGDALVLAGRCYERESLPFKAVDTIVDALSRFLSELSSEEVTALLPEHTHALTRLFPVLKTVRTIAKVKGKKLAVDPQVARRRALVALRDLLRGVGQTRPLILRIDDFQWGDADSAVFLAGLLGPPNPPGLLLLISYRRDDVATSVSLQVLLERLESRAVDKRALFLPVDRLSAEEASLLIRTRSIGMGEMHDESVLRRVAMESQGSPFFVEEMMRYLHSGMASKLGPSDAAPITLRETMLARVASLSEPQRKLLDVVAIAGSPISEEIAFRASGLSAADGTVVSVLRAGRLVRSNREGVVAKLESYHDRIRELLVETASPQHLEESYRALACAFEMSTPAEAESIADFFSRAGDLNSAAEHALRAAQSAMDALAFKRAAHYYRMALEGEHAEAMELELRIKLAQALSSAGQGEAASMAHLEVAERAPAALALDQRRQAAESFMRSGHVDRAVSLFREVLASVGLGFPTSNRRALLNLLWWRMYLRLRGVAFRERSAEQIRPEALIKIDVCGSCGLAFGVNDSFRGAEFQTRHVILALRAGEPERVGLGLAVEASYRSLEGYKNRADAEVLIARSRELATKVGSSTGLGYAQFSEAVCVYQCGQWQQALDYFDMGARIFLRDCHGQQASACQCERLAVDALFFLGEIREFSQRVPSILQAAEERGDLHGVIDMQTGSPNCVWLVHDQPEEARAQCEQGERQWSERRFFLQHYYLALAHINIDLYEGRGSNALERCDAMWGPLKRSFLLRVSVVGAQASFLQGRALITAASEQSSEDRRPLLKRCRKVARHLGRQKIDCAQGWSTLLLAQVAELEGRRPLALELLRGSIEELQRQKMMLCMHAASWLLASLVEDAESSSLRKSAEGWALSQGIANPAKFLTIMAPLGLKA